MPRQPMAFFSVFNDDKTPQVLEFGRFLLENGFGLASSGGTHKFLAQGGLPATDVSQLVVDSQLILVKKILKQLSLDGHEDQDIIAAMLRADPKLGAEILGGRVKTLRPEVLAGILAKDTEEDSRQLEDAGYRMFDLVFVTLYPFSKVAADPQSAHAQIIENIDVGGVNLLHACCKGYDRGTDGRIVICDAADISDVTHGLQQNDLDEPYLRRLAAKAQAHVANYHIAISEYLGRGEYTGWVGERVEVLGYGENRWQGDARLYRTLGDMDPFAVPRFEQIDGGEPGYINETDLDRLLMTVTHIAAGFELNFRSVPLICVGVKHGNVCGAAVGEDVETVIREMVSGHPQDLFGGFVMTNFPIDAKTAEILRRYEVEGTVPRILDVVIAPAVTPEALKVLERKDNRCRVFVNKAIGNLGMDSLDRSLQLRPVRGGGLKQGPYDFVLDLIVEQLEWYGPKPTEQVLRDIVLAWAVGSTSNSNTITVAKDGRTLANAVGQQSRIGAAQLAEARTVDSEQLDGAVAYSDSFFPFLDAVAQLHAMRVKVIFTSRSPRESIWNEIVSFCEQEGIALIAGPDRVVRGFFGH